MTDAPAIRSLEDARTVIASLLLNQEQLEQRIRYMEKILDTRATPLRRRILFRVDGWPSWTTVAAAPAWRPWRRWWTS